MAQEYARCDCHTALDDTHIVSIHNEEAGKVIIIMINFRSHEEAVHALYNCMGADHPCTISLKKLEEKLQKISEWPYCFVSAWRIVP